MLYSGSSSDHFYQEIPARIAFFGYWLVSTSIPKTADNPPHMSIRPLTAPGLKFMCVKFHEAVIIPEVTGGHFIQFCRVLKKMVSLKEMAPLGNNIITHEYILKSLSSDATCM